jgi:Ca2+-binding RTX toxin-like protein
MPLLIPTAGDDTLANGAPSRDTISGFDGNDNLVGGAQRDIFREGAFVWDGDSTADLENGEFYEFGRGNDRIWGGEGFDTLSYAGSEFPIQMFAERGIIRSATGEDLVRQVELIILTNQADRVSGGQEGLAIGLRGGNDRLWMVSGVGAVDGGKGSDTVIASASAGPVDIDLSRVQNLIGDGVVALTRFENVIGSSTASNVLAGNGRANMLTGGSDSDAIGGRSGNDILYGGGGNDVLIGGRGADSISGGDGNDAILDNRGDGTYRGGDGDDLIMIRDGAARGDDGNDRLIWKSANTSAFFDGGAGEDRFVFRNTDSGRDGAVVIDDFTIDEDHLRVDGVSTLSDFSLIEDVAEGVALTLSTGDSSALTITLAGLTGSELSDAIFG